ncbi:MAG: type III-A CRISPR-associated protein Cas10/Csm1 [Deltaproteobacteria bacterium RBG_13_51_10]|nr:MAG: type III-A CRISPR-associated protein Cas10/Csm1 [Deltaproteobacteria bacterium RBG_13_51_10]
MESFLKYEVILGALLHDIGKFFQRASPSEGILSEISRRMENTVCPVSQGRYSHRHVLFTNEFCDQYLSSLPQGLNKSSITNLAIFHHRPESSQQKIIQKADVLSSGMEREDDEEYSGGPSTFRKVRLRSIMGEINIQGREIPESGLTWVHKLEDLHPEKAFPITEDPKIPHEDLTKEYQKLWKQFLIAWGSNRVADPWGFINRALGILEHFTWCIPSATNVFPDISLYDHLKTTAAIAGCLAESEVSSEPFLLVAADFGGIQNYIYSIRTGAGGLARRLRARSFFVALLSDALVYKILRSLGFPLSNCLMASGGKSYLLLPNTEKSRDVLEQVRREIDEWSIKETRGEIRINIATATFSDAGLRDFSTSLEKVNLALRDEKERPLASCLQSGKKWTDFREVLAPLAIPDNGGLCDSCQRNGGIMRSVRDRMIPVCDRCHEDQEAGRFLPHSEFVAFYEGFEGRFHLPFGSYDLLESLDKFYGNPYLILSLEGYKDSPAGLPLVSGFRSRYVPRNSYGDIKTFEELAEVAQGRKSLAYLKSDVDNLGFIFGFGLKRNGEGDRTSISRLTTLSRFLDLFFSGYFNSLLEKEFPEVYTIYSGGDDLLCIGPWDQVMALGLRIREQFSQYSCRNPAWSISTGICLVGSRTPVLSAVSATDNLLDASKEVPGEEIVPWPWKFTPGSAGKDRVTVFGTSIPWRKYPEILKQAIWASNLLQSGTINNSKVIRLLKYAEMYRAFQRTGDTRNFRYVPLLSYDLRRNWEPGGKEPEEREALEWAQLLLNPDSPEMAKVRFICEYALNSLRGKEGNNV